MPMSTMITELVSKSEYKVETVLVHIVDSSIRCPPHQARHVQGGLYSDWNASWGLTCFVANSGNTPPMYSHGLVAFGYKYGLRSDLSTPNFIFWGGKSPHPMYCIILTLYHTVGVACLHYSWKFPVSVPQHPTLATFHSDWWSRICTIWKKSDYVNLYIIVTLCHNVGIGCICSTVLQS